MFPIEKVSVFPDRGTAHLEGTRFQGVRCIAPKKVENAASLPCLEGPIIVDGRVCTADCGGARFSTPKVLRCVAGVLTPPTFNCERFACPAPTKDSVAHAAEGGTCAEGENIRGGGDVCSPSCDFGFTPSETKLECDLRWAPLLEPLGFECLPMACAAPQSVEHAAATACVEGPSIPSGMRCTPLCSAGYKATRHYLQCAFGVLKPHDFACEAEACVAPRVLHSAGTDASPDAAEMLAAMIANITSSCAEGPLIASGLYCTPQCKLGYTPDIGHMECLAGSFHPPTFICLGDACVAPMQIMHTSSETGACNYGPFIPSGHVCQALCTAGFVPVPAQLLCHGGVLAPQSFSCYRTLESDSGRTDADASAVARFCPLSFDAQLPIDFGNSTVAINDPGLRSIIRLGVRNAFFADTATAELIEATTPADSNGARPFRYLVSAVLRYRLSSDADYGWNRRLQFADRPSAILQSILFEARRSNHSDTFPANLAVGNLVVGAVVESQSCAASGLQCDLRAVLIAEAVCTSATCDGDDFAVKGGACCEGLSAGSHMNMNML